MATSTPRRARGLTRINEWVPCPQPDFCKVNKHRTNSGAYLRCRRRIGRAQAAFDGIPTSDLDSRQGAVESIAAFNKAMSSQEYMALVNDFRRKRVRRDGLAAKLDDMKKAIKKGEAEETPAYFRLCDQVYEATMAEVEAKSAMDTRLNTILFDHVQAASQNGTSADMLLDWNTSEVDGVEAYYPGDPGSVEWLQARQQGFGGSDAATILLGAPADRNALAQDKLAIITEPQLPPETPEQMTARHRGDMLEAMNALEFQAQNPHLHFVRDKRTYRSEEHPHMQANLDGLIVDDEGDPIAVWESKTTDNWDEWLYGIPPRFQAQLDHQMFVTGTKTAYITVRMNGNETKTFERTWGEPIADPNPDADPPIPRKPISYKENVDSFKDEWEKVETGEVTEYKSRKFSLPEYTTHKVPRVRTIEENSGIFKMARGLFGENKARAYLLDPVVDATTGEPVPATIKERWESMVEAEKIDPNTTFTYFDTETTGFGENTNDIIELAGYKVNLAGEVIDTFHELYSPDPRFLQAKGTGASHIHGIEPEDVQGRPVLRQDKEAQQRFASFIGGDNNVLVGHNNYAFDDRMLRHVGEDVRNAVDSATGALDTMVMSQYFLPEYNSNALVEVAGFFDIEHESAHRADTDAEVGLSVMFKMFDKMGIRR